MWKLHIAVMILVYWKKKKTYYQYKNISEIYNDKNTLLRF